MCVTLLSYEYSRITQERLSEFRRLRNQGNPPERSRFMTLEQFLQEDAFRSNRNRTAELGGFITLEQFLLRQEEERQRSMKSEDRPGPSHELAHFEREYEEERRHQDSQSRFRGRLKPKQILNGTNLTFSFTCIGESLPRNFNFNCHVQVIWCRVPPALQINLSQTTQKNQC